MSKEKRGKRNVIKISFMSKQGSLPEGIYAYMEGKNCWYPVVYFRKAKHADKKMFRVVIDYLKRKD